MTKRNYLKAPLLLVALIGCCCSLFAQDKSISGKVTDSKDGKPMPGVTVKLKNSSLATSTDSAGVFKITAPSAESIITISHVGFGLQEVKAGAGTSPIKISLVQQSNQLEDVVIIGYGSQKARNVTGAIVSVDTKKLEDLPVASVTEALRGMVPGLNVVGGSTRPGTMPSLNIRQQFNWGKDGGNTNPLVIIDDVIQIDPSTGLNTMDRFNLLDISEIESISVVKDGSAGIYGSRGSQGAIIVKTKRGKLGAPKIVYSGKFETNDAVSHENVLTGKDFGIYSNRFGRAAGWNANSFFSDAELAKMDGINNDWLRNDWEKGSAFQQSITVSGGSDKATFFTGGSYYTQQPNLGTQDFSRWSFRAGTDVKVVNNLKLNATISATNSNVEKSFTKINFSDGYAVGGEQNDYSVLLHMPRYIPWVYNVGGVDRYVSPAMGPNKIGSASGNNSLGNWNYYSMTNNGSKATNETFGYNANFSLQYDVPFIKGLSAKFNYAIASTSDKGDQIQMPLTLSLASNTNTVDNHLYTSTTTWNAPVVNRSNSRVTYSNSTGTSQQMNFFLNYDQTFGKHNVSGMVSAEKVENNYDFRYQIYENPIPGGYNGASNSAGTLNPSNTYTTRQQSGSLSYLGRLSYNYASKYLAQFIFRSDASSRFAPANYWGFFPGISVGWVVSEENFFRDNITWMDQLKVRASLAKTGNDNVKPWKWTQLYALAVDKGQGFGSNGGNFGSGLAPDGEPNPDLHWDQTIQRNIGLDMSFLKNRLSVTFDGYYNSSTDMLTDMGGAVNVPISVGGAFAERNYSALNYWGTEISATWKENIGQVNYSVGLNFGWGNNETVKYLDVPFNYPSTIGRKEGYSTIRPGYGFTTWKNTSTGDGILRTNADVDAYWQYLTDLATAAGEAPRYFDVTSKTGIKKGMMAYEDQAGALDSKAGTIAGKNGRIADDEDFVELVKKNQSYGITTNLGVSWKSFSLSAQISTGWGGLNFLDAVKQGTSSTNAMWTPSAYLSDMYDSTDNQNGKYPNMFYYDQAYKPSDFWVMPSFRMVVRSLSIGYTLPKNTLKAIKIDNARFVFSGYNLWDLYNPYPNKFRNMYDGPKLSYPTLRTWSLGINLGF